MLLTEKEITDLLDKFNIDVECFNPLEIRKRNTGDFVSGFFTQMVIIYLKENNI